MFKCRRNVFTKLECPPPDCDNYIDAYILIVLFWCSHSNDTRFHFSHWHESIFTLPFGLMSTTFDVYTITIAFAFESCVFPTQIELAKNNFPMFCLVRTSRTTVCSTSIALIQLCFVCWLSTLCIVTKTMNHHSFGYMHIAYFVDFTIFFPLRSYTVCEWNL